MASIKQIEDTRNVVDRFKYWTEDAIRSELDANRNNFSVLCCNIERDINVGNTIRSANAFLAKEVIVFGSRRIDRRGCVGVQNYTNFKYISSLDELVSYLQDKNVVGIDNIEKSKDISTYKWDYNKHTVMCFGEECNGLADEIVSLCQDLVYIKQYGSVRSLNVATAAGICMYDYMSKKVIS